MKDLLKAVLFPVSLLLLSFSAYADKVVKGDYTIYYNAFNSTMLQADIASEYGINRSRYQGVVNISIQKTDENDSDENIIGVPAAISGSATNLVGQRRDLSFKKIQEATAVYYIANVGFTDEETLNFDLQIRPEGSSQQPINLRFTQQFFVD